MAVVDYSGVRIPDSKIAREASEFIRETESTLLFDHSTRVYLWGAMAGHRAGVNFDPELLYTAAMFHDVGLTAGFRKSKLRFEVDGANAARDFLRSHGVAEESMQKVWLAIALHTTPGIPPSGPDSRSYRRGRNDGPGRRRIRPIHRRPANRRRNCISTRSRLRRTPDPSALRWP